MLNRSINTELKVGLFTVVGLAAMGLVVVTLEGNPFAKRSLTFYTLLDNVGGVGPRTQVRTSGVQIGEVSKLEILSKGAKVSFQIRSDVDIPEGSIIELRSRGILGDVFLEIVRNDGGKETMKEGSLIPKIKEFNDFSSLMASVGNIARDLQTVSHTLANVLGNTDGQSSLQNILANIERITSDSREIVSGQRSNVARLITGMRDAAERLSGLLARNDGRIDQTLSDVSVAVRDLKGFAGDLRNMVSGDNRKHIDQILASADATMSSARTVAAKVGTIVDKVEKGEGTLGQIISKDDTANDLRQTMKGLQEILRPATHLKMEIDYKGELRSKETEALGRTANHFNVRLATRPDRFYQVGLSDSPTSHKVTRTRTTTNVDGTQTTAIEEQGVAEESGRLKFNLQYAKRWSDLGVRFGFFESSAGIAADGYFFDDKLQTSLEAFNFSSPATADERMVPRGYVRLKAYANFFLTPNVYLTGGMDNAGKQPGPLGFAGAGLRFTDEDLKSVIGVAGAASLMK